MPAHGSTLERPATREMLLRAQEERRKEESARHEQMVSTARTSPCTAFNFRTTTSQKCCGKEAGSYLRLIDSCITQLKAQGPSRTCNESKEEEKAPPPALEGVQCELISRKVFTKSFCKSQFPTRIRRLILHISYSKGYVDGFVGELTSANRLSKHFVGDKSCAGLCCEP